LKLFFEYSNSKDHIPALDGIRGIAVLMVIAYHLIPFPLGWMGVDLFFVLSGFLITSILIDTKDAPNYFSNFIIKRSLRIFPLYFGVLILYFSPFVAFKGLVLAKDAFPYLLYLQNIKFTISNSWPTNYLYPLNHFWSLAIEEQFYVIFPFIVYVTPFKNLGKLCLGIVSIAILSRLYFIFQSNQVGPYAFTVCRADALALGAYAAYYVRRRNYIYSILLVCATMIIIVQISLNRNFTDLIYQSFGYTVNSIFFALLLIASLSRDFKLASIFRSPVLRHVGKYSYGLYIFHHIYYTQLEYLLPKYFNFSQTRLIVIISTLVLTYLTARFSSVILNIPS
jgi:peptidoglycan/LPS O-acetylase OafA/YrhL